MMIRSLILASAVSLSGLALAPAEAQRNYSGSTTSDVAASLYELRQSHAELRVQVRELETANASLTGEIETLQFLLSETRDENNALQEDDAEIGRRLAEQQEGLDAQRQQIERLIREVEALREAVISGDPELLEARTAAANEADAGQYGSTTRRTVSRSAVDEDDGATGYLRGEDAPQSEDGGDPRQVGSLGTLPASELPGNAGPLFAEAKSRLLQFDYQGAEVAFREFLDRFGDDPQAGEAQYWLGEVLFQQGAYSDSGQAYTQMIREYPDDPRAPDALVKLARSMRLIDDTDRACEALSILPQRYPDASGVTRNLAAVERARSNCGG